MLAGFISVARKNMFISTDASEFIHDNSAMRIFFWKIVFTLNEALWASLQTKNKSKTLQKAVIASPMSLTPSPSEICDINPYTDNVMTKNK